MKRRVLVAQALVHKPPVIVLDEPTAGVDVELRHDMWRMVRELRQRGHAASKARVERLILFPDLQIVQRIVGFEFIRPGPPDFIERERRILPKRVAAGHIVVGHAGGLAVIARFETGTAEIRHFQRKSVIAVGPVAPHLVIVPGSQCRVMADDIGCMKLAPIAQKFHPAFVRRAGKS